VGSHHLTREVILAGHTAIHIGPLISPFHVILTSVSPSYRERAARALRSPTLLQERLFSAEGFCVLPWALAKWIAPLGEPFVHLSNIGSVVSRCGSGPIDILLVDDPRLAGIETILKPKALYYRPTDLYGKWKDDVHVIEAERRLLASCDGLIATSQPVLNHALELRPGLPHLLLENGVDFERFSTVTAEPDDLKAIPHPRAIYVGALDDRFDTRLLDYMAEQLPDVHFVIVGPGKNLRRVQELGKPNIHSLGPRAYPLVPGYLQFSEVGLLPLSDNIGNSGRSPMKLYEYGAAGLPIVSKITPELARRRESFVHFFSSPEESVEVLRNVLLSPVDRKKIAEACRVHSWSNKVSTLLEFVRKSSGHSVGNGHF
jgi:glycosyltransferase involved in cell wall biosynthesis